MAACSLLEDEEGQYAIEVFFVNCAEQLCESVNVYVIRWVPTCAIVASLDHGSDPRRIARMTISNLVHLYKGRVGPGSGECSPGWLESWMAKTNCGHILVLFATNADSSCPIAREMSIVAATVTR